MAGRPRPTHPVDDLLEQQAGLLTSAQALARGITSSTIRANLAARRWQRVHPRVYATTTGALDLRARIWAVVLYAGPGAVASHQTAAELDGLSEPAGGPVHVSVPAARRVKAEPGMVVHRSRRLPEAAHPTRSPPRTRIEETVLDLADGARSLDQAVALVANACQRRLTTVRRLRVALDRRRNLRRRGDLAAVLSDVDTGVHSVLEHRYHRRVELPHDLPSSVWQVRLEPAGVPMWCDVRYLAYTTVVELDGRLGHAEPDGRLRDMRRDNLCVVTGHAPLRYGWADVTERPCRVAAKVGAVLRQRGWEGSPRSCGPGCSTEQPPPRS